MKFNENLSKGSDSDMEPTKKFNLLTDVRVTIVAKNDYRDRSESVQQYGRSRVLVLMPGFTLYQ